MEFQFLGTGAGTPSKTRNVSALALRLRGARHWALVDCGEGTQHQILRTGWSLHELGAVFITHMHGDHCYGLPGLLASAGMMNRSAPLHLVGPALPASLRCCRTCRYVPPCRTGSRRGTTASSSAAKT